MFWVFQYSGKSSVVSINYVINENVNAELGKFSEDKDSAQEEGKPEHVDILCLLCVYLLLRSVRKFCFMLLDQVSGYMWVRGQAVTVVTTS